MAILVPGAGFFNRGGMWEILPPPGAPVVAGAGRTGTKLSIYETVMPVTITAQGNLVCPGGTPFSPTQPSPELIKKVRIDPGTSLPNSGKGVTVLLSRGGVRDIPEMTCPVFRETYLQYGMIAGLAPTLVLTPPITGYVSEKYLYDQEAGFSELYKGSQVPSTKDNLRASTFQGGTGTVKSPGFKRYQRVTTKSVPGSGTLSVSQNTPVPGSELTIGSSAIQGAAAKSNYMWSMRPSLIQVLRFFYTITVESTCPPFIFYFPAYMDVENNWLPHTKRVEYYLNKQVPAPEGTT